jgi:hypothetical protein
MGRVVVSMLWIHVEKQAKRQPIQKNTGKKKDVRLVNFPYQ